MKSTSAKSTNVLSGLLLLVVSLLLFPATSCAPRQSSPSRPEKGPIRPLSTRLLYAEMVGESTSLWIAPADRPKEKKPLARIAHHPGYGIKASLSPDGVALAYTALPPDTGAANQASLWFLNLSEPEPKLLAEGVDLPGTPVWATDGTRLAYRRSTELATGEMETALYVVSLIDRKSTRVVSDSAALGLYPFAWSADGHALYYSRVSKGGTDVVGIEVAAGTMRFSYHVADGIARDFRLSPDDRRILFSSSTNTADSVTYVVSTIDIEDGLRVTLGQGRASNMSAIWRPGSSGITLTSEQSDPVVGGAIVDVLATGKMESRVIAAPPQGFDVPLAWSPDATQLALAHYSGRPAQPGRRTLVIATPSDGRRSVIESAGDVQFIGWMATG